MQAAPLPPDEATRVAALNDLGIIGSPPDAEFDAIVQTASLVCGVPISLISLIGEDRQWFKARIGLDVDETPRDLAFCAHAILGDDLLEVPDAREDARFADNPLVTGRPDIRFYAGVPLLLSDGHRVGTLCVIDSQPRCLDEKQRTILRSLARVAAHAVENWDVKHKQKQTEAILARKKDRVADLIRATNVGTWEWDIGTGELHLDARYAEILGRTLQDMAPAYVEAAFAAVHPEDLPGLIAKIDLVLCGQCGSFDHEFRMAHEQGHLVLIRAHGSVMTRAQDGTAEWLFGTMEDISQRKAQELALGKSQTFLNQTGRLAGVGGWELDLATRQIAWSAETSRIHGLDPGMTPSLHEAISFYAVEARPLIEAAVARAAAGEGGWDLELAFVQSDGTRIWVRSVGSAIFADGKPTRLIGAIQDVTGQVAQRKALLAANERVTLATETAGIGIWEWDPAANTLAWDDRMYALYDRPRTAQALTFEDWLQAVHPEDRARAGDAARAAAEGMQAFYSEFRIVLPDGAIRHCHAIARAYGDEQGQIVRMVGVNWDVTDARLMEAERNERERELRVVNGELERTARHLAKARDAADLASRAKTRFLAGMSHELRTPLNGILGYAQLLRLEGGLSETQASRVGAMLDAGTHLLEMISSVLELSEIETEHVELRPIEVDLSKIAMASLALVRPHAEAKGLRLNCCADLDAPRTLVTDQMRLRQIILNLLGNAVKFTESGQVELRLRTAARGTALRIDITDTGPGIEPDQRSRLFQDFERLHANITGIVEGAGLGLALFARLAALLGGRIGHDENPGGGSIFWLELPLDAMAPGTAPASVPSPLPGPVGPGSEHAPADPARKLRILVVDDMPMNRDIACSFLRAAGHETICAATGEQAIEAARAARIDVVLMDVQMPEVDGLEATRRIRLLEGPAGQVPIIGLTAQAFSEQVLACKRAGMDGHLSKPYTPDALSEAVANAAALRREQDAGAAGNDPNAPPGAELPVLDTQAVTRMEAYLAPALIDSYLRSIVERCEAMLAALRLPDAHSGNDPALAEAVHTLAGNAGMFGFARLANCGILLERALRRRAPDTAGPARNMVAAIEATLCELRSRPVSKAA